MSPNSEHDLKSDMVKCILLKNLKLEVKLPSVMDGAHRHAPVCAVGDGAGIRETAPYVDQVYETVMGVEGQQQLRVYIQVNKSPRG